jgi:hypothetical protein
MLSRSQCQECQSIGFLAALTLRIEVPEVRRRRPKLHVLDVATYLAKYLELLELALDRVQIVMGTQSPNAIPNTPMPFGLDLAPEMTEAKKP